MYGIKRNHTYLGAIYRTINKYSPRVLLTLSAILIGYIAWIIYTSPEPYIDDIGPQSCSPIDVYQDEEPFDYSSFTSYEELFPEDNEYGKDGEILLPDSTEPFLGIIPDLGIEMYALPYYPPVIAHTPSTTNTPETPRTIRPVPNLVPFGWWHKQDNNKSSTPTSKSKPSVCDNPIEIDEPEITWLMLLTFSILVFTKRNQ